MTAGSFLRRCLTMDEIKSKLFYEQKNGYDLIDTAERVAVEDYCR